MPFFFVFSSMDFVAYIRFYLTPLTGSSKGKTKATKRKPSKGTSPVNSCICVEIIVWQRTFLKRPVIDVLNFTGAVQLNSLVMWLVYTKWSKSLILLCRGPSIAGGSGLCCSAGWLSIRYRIKEEENWQEAHSQTQWVLVVYFYLLFSVWHTVLIYAVAILNLLYVQMWNPLSLKVQRTYQLGRLSSSPHSLCSATGW